MKIKTSRLAWASLGLVLYMGSAQADLFGSRHGSGNLCMQNNGGSLGIALCSSQAGQQFQFSGYGAIQQGGACLEASREGSALALKPCNNAKNQKWGMRSDGQLNNEQGWCADIKGASRNAGAAVIAWKCNGQSNQKWVRAQLRPLSSLPAAAQVQVRNAPVGSGFRVSGGNVIASGAANVIASGAGNVIAAGGGNIIASGGAN